METISRKKISCIIPTYNEAPRIGKILQIVCDHKLLDEIIVIDDGSKDNTQDIVKKHKKAKLFINKKNQGKSKTVARGIMESKGEFILLLDADLIGLTAKNISDLIEPIISKKADLCISLRKNCPWFAKKIGLDYISGERIFAKKFVQDYLCEMKKLPSFGLEVFLNRLIIKNKSKIKIIYWENVLSPWPYQKRNFFLGMKNFFSMIGDILKVISVFEIIYQNTKMLSLKIK